MNRRDAETRSKTKYDIKDGIFASVFIRANPRLIFLLCVSASLRFAVTVITLAACSIPNLEAPECTESRNAVKQFYSFHFGNDMRPSPENLKLREKYLSSELFESLSRRPESPKDYFTATENYPKAFRIGTCEVISADATRLQVLLFWRDDTKSEQKEVTVEVVKADDKWLIDDVLEK